MKGDLWKDMKEGKEEGRKRKGKGGMVGGKKRKESKGKSKEWEGSKEKEREGNRGKGKEGRHSFHW